MVFSTISFHLRPPWTCCANFISFIFFRSFLTPSSLRDLLLPTGLPVDSFLCIFSLLYQICSAEEEEEEEEEVIKIMYIIN